MQRELGFARKIRDNKVKTENLITTTTALALTVATTLLPAIFTSSRCRKCMG
jgi:hypothetical protein